MQLEGPTAAGLMYFDTGGDGPVVVLPAPFRGIPGNSQVTTSGIPSPLRDSQPATNRRPVPSPRTTRGPGGAEPAQGRRQHDEQALHRRRTQRASFDDAFACLIRELHLQGITSPPPDQPRLPYES